MWPVRARRPYKKKVLRASEHTFCTRVREIFIGAIHTFRKTRYFNSFSFLFLLSPKRSFSFMIRITAKITSFLSRHNVNAISGLRYRQRWLQIIFYFYEGFFLFFCSLCRAQRIERGAWQHCEFQAPCISRWSETQSTEIFVGGKRCPISYQVQRLSYNTDIRYYSTKNNTSAISNR